jgi:hypothetical protein
MKVRRFNDRIEDMAPSTILELETLDYIRFEETEEKRMREEIKLLHTVIGEILNEMETSGPPNALYNIIRRAVNVVRPVRDEIDPNDMV